MRRGEVELRADRHDAGRFHVALVAGDVPFALKSECPK
jgi:hypothetical protein